ncbi:MAG: hypothetical protein UHD09_09630 [Bifidobacterium sp.]|nr:hypothetical protein [Bifidobacterium sp.]
MARRTGVSLPTTTWHTLSWMAAKRRAKRSMSVASAAGASACAPSGGIVATVAVATEEAVAVEVVVAWAVADSTVGSWIALLDRTVCASSSDSSSCGSWKGALMG